MLRRVKELRGYTIQAVDGEIGSVDDFYFDDHAWTVRYLVVKTGGWLSGRKVLLSPAALKQPKDTEKRLPVALSKQQVEDSPDASVETPVSRQYEQDLHQYYGWAPYWSNLGSPVNVLPPILPMVEETQAGAVAPPPASDAPVREPAIQKTETPETGRDVHLRSMNEVSGYHIQATNGEIGHVETFIVDDESWAVRYLVVDTSNWLPGKKVLMALQWVEAVDWPSHEVRVNLQRETIENSPEYEAKAPVSRAYEKDLYEYYGRPTYW